VYVIEQYVLTIGSKKGLLYVRITLLRTYTPMYRSRMVPDLTSPRQYPSLDRDSQSRLELVSIKTKV
jgi:hypothetical protein